MSKINRRQALRGMSAGVLGGALLSSHPDVRAALPAWARGIEGQRRADLGDGRFLNPVMAGDHPDPSILKDGRDYCLTFSTFTAYPAPTIWHSRDLVNWLPRNAALHTNGKGVARFPNFQYRALT